MGKTVAQYNLWVNLDLCRAARAGEQPNNLGQHAKLLGGAMHVAQKARKRGAPAPRDAAVLEAIHGDAACALSLFLLDNADMPLPSDFAYSTDDVLPMAYVPLARSVQAAYRWLYADMRLLLLCPCGGARARNTATRPCARCVLWRRPNCRTHSSSRAVGSAAASVLALLPRPHRNPHRTVAPHRLLALHWPPPSTSSRRSATSCCVGSRETRRPRR